MERKTGYKECPKCGLRNKPGATQCDFCGQNLGSSDDWQQHIKDLESLNKMELRKPLDDRTSKRIESTIIRKDAPAIRNVEIKEAGNIGKVLRELDAPPATDLVKDTKAEKPRQLPVQDKLRIKETGSVTSVEKGPEDTPASEGVTIADILKEPAKETEPKEPLADTPLVEQAPPTEPTPVAAVAPAKEAEEQPIPTTEEAPEPEKADVPPSPDTEPASIEIHEEPAITAVPEASEQVPAMEVTVEVVQPPQEDVATEQNLGDGNGEVAMSTTDSHETIKLKLVKVERSGEKLAPMILKPSLGPRGTAAIAVLAVGSIAYLAVLTLTALGTLETVAGLGGGAVSSLMIIYGAVVIYPSLRRKKEDEVYICPKCHEKVGESSEGCPACGAEFETEG